MISYEINDYSEKYSGYGYDLTIKNIFNPITHNYIIVSEVQGGNLIKLKFNEKQESLSINCLNIPISANLLDIFDNEYQNAKNFIKEFEIIKKTAKY